MYTTIQKFGVSMFFFNKVFSAHQGKQSHLFNQKHSKVVKYYYNIFSR